MRADDLMVGGTFEDFVHDFIDAGSERMHGFGSIDCFENYARISGGIHGDYPNLRPRDSE